MNKTEQMIQQAKEYLEQAQAIERSILQQRAAHRDRVKAVTSVPAIRRKAPAREAIMAARELDRECAVLARKRRELLARAEEATEAAAERIARCIGR